MQQKLATFLKKLFSTKTIFLIENILGFCSGFVGLFIVESESGKLITWGSADDEGQSYLTSGKHGVMR